MATGFSSLPLSADMLANLQAMSYQQMTPIQAQSLPDILQGKDILAQAKTGSGKTAAFGLGLLHRLEPADYHAQALVLCPTRELAEQVSKELRRLARAVANTKITTLCGGYPMGPQLASLEHQPHIVVGTPGRIAKHLQKQSLDLSRAGMLVLDEADRMLDMGFYDEIMDIIKYLPQPRQTLLFSASYPEEITDISHSIQHEPVEVRVQAIHDNSKIEQIAFEIPKGERTKALQAILQHYRPASCLVFCNRKQQCQELAEELWARGFHAQALHGDLEQQERDRVLIQFANNSSSVLIATDVAARGIDIKELPLVVNFELSKDPEVHIHRIGRTGRADSKGLALSLFLTSEASRISAIEDYQNSPIRIASLATLKTRDNFNLKPAMVTLGINGGRKDKLRPGDILGALTANPIISAKLIGKIDITERIAYVAVDRSIAKQALKTLSENKIKARKFRVRRLR